MPKLKRQSNVSGRSHRRNERNRRRNKIILQRNARKKALSEHQNIIKLEDRVLAIAAYDNNMTYSEIAELLNFQEEQIKEIVQKRHCITENYNMYTIKSREIMIRRQKIELLGQCVYENIQRVQYHTNANLDDDMLLDSAAIFSELLQIKHFIVGKSWLNQFKSTYNINFSQRQLVLKRTPPVLLSPKKIIAYCRRYCRQFEQENKEEKDQDSQESKTETNLVAETPVTMTTEEKLRVLRQQKIEILEKALYEYIQRSQYHRKTTLNEELQIRVACELQNTLKIDKFLPNKNWHNHFKVHYNISTSQRMIVINRIPPSSLDLMDILSYCGFTSMCPQTGTLEHVDTQEGEEQKFQSEEQRKKQHIFIDLEVEPDTIVTMEPTDVAEEDIKPDVMDIEIELPEIQEQILPSYSTTTQDDGEEEEEVHAPRLNIQKVVSLQLEDSSDDDKLPKLTKTNADALQKLKSLEHFSLLEENYRAIGLITQLENIFKNPPSKLN